MPGKWPQERNPTASSSDSQGPGSENTTPSKDGEDSATDHTVGTKVYQDASVAGASNSEVNGSGRSAREGLDQSNSVCGNEESDEITPKHVAMSPPYLRVNPTYESLHSNSAPLSTILTPPDSDTDTKDNTNPSSESLPKEWDFILPRIKSPSGLVPGGVDGEGTFSMRDLLGAVQNGFEYDKIDSYISYYDRKVVEKRMKEDVLGFPPIFYAAESNNVALVRLWVKHGSDLNAVHNQSGIPLLAFTVINADYIQKHTTHMLATLLSIGASPKVFPRAFFIPFNKDLPDEGPDENELDADLQNEKRAWCAPERIRQKLTRTLNLTQRYHLERSAKMKKPSARHRQVADRRKAENLLGIEYFLIGQSSAATSLKLKLLSYMTLPSKRPLVLVFAGKLAMQDSRLRTTFNISLGPSGHGKTELARRLGNLLSLPMEVADCTTMKVETDVFGHRPPYNGAKEGSPVNNFICQYAGRRSIIFLDEFEKTTDDVHKALLIPFDNGKYKKLFSATSRINHSQVNTKTEGLERRSTALK
jgi:hypothetical protein